MSLSLRLSMTAGYVYSGGTLLPPCMPAHVPPSAGYGDDDAGVSIDQLCDAMIDRAWRWISRFPKL